MSHPDKPYRSEAISPDVHYWSWMSAVEEFLAELRIDSAAEVAAGHVS